MTCVLIDNAGRHNGSRTPDVRCCRQSLVTRRHRPAWRWQSGSRLPWMVVSHLQNCTWRTSPFDAGQEDAELVHLKEHLSWRVQRGHDTCAGCWQTWGEDTPLLTCSGCSGEVLQRRSQKDGFEKAGLGGFLRFGRHKDICGVLRKWREVVKDGVAPDSCAADLVACLQRKSAHP